jgi:hypothetical protein
VRGALACACLTINALDFHPPFVVAALCKNKLGWRRAGNGCNRSLLPRSMMRAHADPACRPAAAPRPHLRAVPAWRAWPEALPAALCPPATRWRLGGCCFAVLGGGRGLRPTLKIQTPNPDRPTANRQPPTATAAPVAEPGWGASSLPVPQPLEMPYALPTVLGAHATVVGPHAVGIPPRQPAARAETANDGLDDVSEQSRAPRYSSCTVLFIFYLPPMSTCYIYIYIYIYLLYLPSISSI